MGLPSLPAYPIRVSVRAVIEQSGSVLLVKFDDEHGPHYNWPGGGMDFGESIHQALVREVWEETNAEIEIGELFCIYEHLLSTEIARTGLPQTISLIFRCSLCPGTRPCLPEQPDPYEVAVEWISINDLQDYWILPDITQTVQSWSLRTNHKLPIIVNREDT